MQMNSRDRETGPFFVVVRHVNVLTGDVPGQSETCSGSQSVHFCTVNLKCTKEPFCFPEFRAADGCNQVRHKRYIRYKNVTQNSQNVTEIIYKTTKNRHFVSKL